MKCNRVRRYLAQNSDMTCCVEEVCDQPGASLGTSLTLNHHPPPESIRRFSTPQVMIQIQHRQRRRPSTSYRLMTVSTSLTNFYVGPWWRFGYRMPDVRLPRTETSSMSQACLNRRGGQATQMTSRRDESSERDKLKLRPILLALLSCRRRQ